MVLMSFTFSINPRRGPFLTIFATSQNGVIFDVLGVCSSRFLQRTFLMCF